ncbi:MAG: ABC transporter ATP-binding protein [Chloroflexota bacterium]|nr:MAG: ABC transporter ATP-binding protein [Chloroflexota bacterium]
MDLQEAVTENRFAGMLRLLRGYRLIYAGAILGVGIAAFARTGTYLLLGYFVDEVLVSDNSQFTVLQVALAFIGLSLVMGIFAFISGALAGRTAESIAKRVRDYVFDHIQHLTFTYHDQTNTGELVQRSTSDIDAIRRFFADQAIGIGRISLLFLVNFVALLWLDWRLALISVIVVPFTIALSVIFFGRVSKAYEKYQEQDAILSNRLQENLTGVRVVKAFARQAYEIDKFETENWEKYLRGKRLLLMHSSYWPISDIMTGIQMLAGFTIGALMAINGSITVGQYMTYAGLLIWILWPIRNLGRLIVQMSSGLVSFDRVMTVVKEQREPLDTGDYLPEDTVIGALDFIDVAFAYDDAPDVSVLQEINFSVKPGQVIALLGSTGSGKTTLANLLPRFYEYTAGKILLDGVELKRYTRNFLRSQIGIVEQEPFLFSRTIRENITYGIDRDVPQEEVEDAAKAAAVHEAIMTFPDKYDTLVGEKGVTLSGGQKQRVAIARTIMKNPRILILDDATSSVDLETEADIRQALENLMENRTTFIIAHRIQSVMKADLILVLDKGRIIQMGTHDELLNQEGVYQKIYDIQTQIDAELEKEVASAEVGV